MTSFEIFFWGWVGSVAVDFAAFAKHVQSERKRKLPHYYQSVIYYVVRFGFACVAGGLALAYGVEHKLLAFHIGAAAPLMIVAASQGLPSAQSNQITKE